MTKILIIEDQESLREEINDLFNFEGFQTICASNGQEGIDLALEHNPDLILSDIMMPGMDGNEVLAELRNHSSTRLIPFIFMTALAERENFRAGMEMGADDYITKPFTWDELLNSVNSRLKKSKEIRDHSETTLNELRTNIITALPHELRTPLNGILGYGQLLKDNPEIFNVEELKDVGANIYKASMRLYRLIQNYLLYAQLELRKEKEGEQIELNNPHEICEDIAKEVAVKYNRPNDLDLNLNKSVVHMPHIEFSKIVEELTDNAFKFSTTGTKVEIKCGIEDDTFVLYIKDHGCGMDKDNLEKIGAYMQFNRKLQEQQGSGLGLIIVKRIVDLFYGKLSIQSKVNQGCNVTVTFQV